MPRELKTLVIEEVSAVDAPANAGARVVLLKRDGRAAEIADLQRRIDALLAKQTAPVPGAPTITKEAPVSQAMRKRVANMALETGATTFTKLAAEAVIEAKAREVQKRDGGSFEQAYVTALFDPANREVAAVLAH